MGNTRWSYRVLKVREADKLISENRRSLRVNVMDGTPHLEILLKDKAGKLYYKILGRLRKDAFQRHKLVLMEEQSPFINQVFYKFE